MLKRESPSDLDVLLQIMKFIPEPNKIPNHIEYLEWFLKRCSHLILKEDQLVFTNVQYISPSMRTESSGGSLYGIPSLIDAGVKRDEALYQYIAGIMAFLGAVRLFESPTPNAVRFAIESFKKKFIIEIIKEEPVEPASSVIEFDRYAGIISFRYPDLYEQPNPAKYFIETVKQYQGFVKESIDEDRFLIDGIQFENALNQLLYSPEDHSFFQEVRKFLSKKEINEHLRYYHTNLMSLMKSSDLQFDKKLCEVFILTGFLHSWLKPVQYTYMIPLTSVVKPGKPPCLGIFLINTQQQLKLEKLNKLHIALGFALKAMGDIESRQTEEAGFQNDVPHQEIPESMFPKTDIAPQIVEGGSDNWRDFQFYGMIGKSAVMQNIFSKIETVARHDEADVLILGESGTGKEGIATAIHQISTRKEKPFIAVSLADYPGTLVESELFGHERGAFTGAYRQKKGCFELANGGTLFLDEICHIPANIQAKLLRVLQNREIQRIGATGKIPVNVRVISATSENITNELLREQFNFIDPLYYRLQEYIIYVPPLREHKDDIPLLVNYFLWQFNQNKERVIRIEETVIQYLLNYNWPGNVRELLNLTKRAYINAYDEGEIRIEHFEFEMFENEFANKDGLEQRLRDVLKFLRASNFVIDRTLRSMAETNSFYPNHKTLMRYCRELCLWFLAQKNWDLSMAIKALAGNDKLEDAAAKKYRDYFLGDKKNTGILYFLDQNPYGDKQAILKLSLVRKQYESLLREFLENYHQGLISSEKWRQILKRYRLY